MFNALGGLVFFAAIAGMIKPKWRLWQKEASNKRYAGVSAVAFFGLVILSGIFDPPADDVGNELAQDVQNDITSSVNEDESVESVIRPGGQIEVLAADYGDKWAFTVESGTLDCIDNNSGVNMAAVIRIPQVGVVALNGIAKDVDGVLSTETVWKDHPSIEGMKVNIGPFIDLANKLCEN